MSSWGGWSGTPHKPDDDDVESVTAGNEPTTPSMDRGDTTATDKNDNDPHSTGDGMTRDTGSTNPDIYVDEDEAATLLAEKDLAKMIDEQARFEKARDVRNRISKQHALRELQMMNHICENLLFVGSYDNPEHRFTQFLRREGIDKCSKLFAMSMEAYKAAGYNMTEGMMNEILLIREYVKHQRREGQTNEYLVVMGLDPVTPSIFADDLVDSMGVDPIYFRRRCHGFHGSS